jgi:hypothetical protein
MLDRKASEPYTAAKARIMWLLIPSDLKRIAMEVKG